MTMKELGVALRGFSGDILAQQFFPADLRPASTSPAKAALGVNQKTANTSSHHSALGPGGPTRGLTGAG